MVDPWSIPGCWSKSIPVDSSLSMSCQFWSIWYDSRWSRSISYDSGQSRSIQVDLGWSYYEPTNPKHQHGKKKKFGDLNLNMPTKIVVVLACFSTNSLSLWSTPRLFHSVEKVNTFIERDEPVWDERWTCQEKVSITKQKASQSLKNEIS